MDFHKITLVLFVLSCICISVSYVTIHPVFNRNNSRMLSNDAEFNIDKFRKSQFDLLVKFQSGIWKGIQTGYDPMEPDVADHMYFDTSLETLDEGNAVKHSTSVVMSEVRADCDVCFDSERIKTKEIGLYQFNNLRSRFCENAELKGPGMTPRGVSCEIAIRHHDCRVRILIALEPYDWGNLDGIEDSVPISMKLHDVVVTREKLEKRPINDDVNPHHLWTPTKFYDSIINDQRYIGTRFRNLPNGDVEKINLDESSLPTLPDTFSTKILEVSHEDQPPKENSVDTTYSRLFPGGIRVECRNILSSGDPYGVRVLWIPEVSKDQPRLDSNSIIYATELEFIGLNRVVKDPFGNSRLAPPVLVDFFVDKFFIIKNSDLK